MLNKRIKQTLIVLAAILVLLIPIIYAEVETPVGSFSIGNDPPPTPYAWTPTTTHNKSQVFSWTEGTDNNGDPK